jgi:hypothetical protein
MMGSTPESTDRLNALLRSRHPRQGNKSAYRVAFTAALLAALFGPSLQSLAQSCTNLCLKQVSCPAGTTTSISGTVYTPNGVDPLPNVVVYVPNATVPAFTPGVACVTSAQPVGGSPLVGTTTSATTPGTYKLTNMPFGTNIPVVIQAGRWRRQYTVNTTKCQNTVLNMQFPTQQSEGDIPLIAVATGSVDAAECVMRKVGIKDTEFTVPTASGGTGRIQLYQGSQSPGIKKDVNGATLPSESVLVGTTVGASSFNNYDIVMFPCQGTAAGQASAASQTNLITYANQGGRVFATHYSYAWLYNVSPFSTTASWQVNQAALTNGPATINTTFAGGQQLAQWLYNIGATKTYGTIDTLTDPKHDQVGVIAPTQSWLTLNKGVSNDAQPVMQLTFDTPVGAISSAQCGRILFNEYHVEVPVTSTGSFPAECDASSMNANEKLLEYSLFDLSTFITPQTPPTLTANISNSPTNFFQGDTTDTVTVNVTNASSTSPANPSLSFTVTLPTGVTAAAMQDASGTGGWLCTVSTLTCTRISGLDANTSDNVNITVSVSPTAPLGMVSASATVTGGGLTSDVTASESFRIYGTALITWPAPAAITYGPALSATQLDATVANNLPGTFIYTPAAGTVLDAGTYTLSTVFTATDTVNYPNPATANVSFTVNQVAQTIAFAPIASPVTYGVAPITLVATGGASGNPVTFTVTGPATLSGSTLTITGAGTVTVTADQAGSTNYSAAASVTQTIIVNQIAQTITFAPIASPVTYGIAPITLVATGGASGNPVTFTFTGPATLSGNTLTITGGGTVTVTANQAGNANYSAATSVTQTLVVNPAAQTITFAAPASPVTYGIAPITLVASASSGLPVSFSVLSGPATVNGSILTITGGGTIVIAADQSGNANYSAAPEVTHIILVNKVTAAISLTATPTTLFIQNPFTLTASVFVPVSCGIPCATPTGTITFMDNGVAITTVTLNAVGVATLTTSYSVIGQHVITAVYNGDNAYNTLSSSEVTQTAMDFSITGGLTPQNVVHGSTVTYTFLITPLGGTATPAAIDFALIGYPYGSTVTFSPASLASGSGITTVTLTLQTASYPTGPVSANRSHSTTVLACLLFGALLLPLGRKLRGKPVRLLATVLLLLASAGAMTAVTGCGTGWNHEDFQLTLQATSGALSHATTATSLVVH